MSLEDVAKRLSLLARQPGTATEALNQVATSLGDGGRALAGTDLIVAYPPEVLVPDVDQVPLVPVRWSRGLEVVRDLLVFLPVGLTWWQLRNALQAYEKSDVDVPFLLGWQRGFDGTVTSLGTAALWVALTVGLIVLLTLVVHAGAPTRTSRAADRRLLAQDLVLATALLNKQDNTGGELVSLRDVSRLGTRISAANRHLIGALERTSTNITGAIDSAPGGQLHSAIVEWTRAAHELKDMGASLRAPGETLAALTRLHESVVEDGRTLRTSLGSLVHQLNEATQRAEAEGQSHREVAGEVARSAERLGESLDVFRERTENLSELVGQLRYALERFDYGQRNWDDAAPLGNAGPSANGDR